MKQINLIDYNEKSSIIIKQIKDDCDGFYNSCREIFINNPYALSFYNYGKALQNDSHDYIQNLYWECLETDGNLGIRKNRMLLDINFNSNDSLDQFKKLCETIHDSFAFKWPRIKREYGLVCVCNDDNWELNEDKMVELHSKLKLIADQNTGKIKVETLERYKSDITLMDFIYMILSYLPKVVKDWVALDEEKCHRWVKKVELKLIINAINHF